MSDKNGLYLEFQPGQLITAEDQNTVQRKVKEDIADTVQKAIDGIPLVKLAENAHKLDDKTLEQVRDDITAYVLQQVQKRSGYLNVYRRLQWDERNGLNEADLSLIAHNFGALPVVDVYRLDYFPVVASEDGERYAAHTLFYLYHGSEKSLRFTSQGATMQVVIEPNDGAAFRTRFSDLLKLYGVRYSDETTLSEVENAFWEAFFAEPNDRFDDDQYAHSPWFDKCCGDERTVGSLRSDWDNIWVKMMPRKTLNHGTFIAGDERDPEQPAPDDVRVVQVNFNTVGLKLIGAPENPQTVPPTVPPIGNVAGFPPPPERKELNVTVILKV